MDTVRIYTAPAAEPVTLEEAKIDLRVDGTADNALITSLIVGARMEAERVAGRSFVTRTMEMQVDRWPAGPFVLRLGPVTAITSLTYYDNTNTLQTVSSSDYTLISDTDPALLVPAVGLSWPSASLRDYSPIRLRYVAGYGAYTVVPDEFKRLIRALVAIDYESRDEMTASQERQRTHILTRLQAEWGVG